MKFKFKEENVFDNRKNEATKIRIKYPERIPVIVEKEPKSQISSIDKRKFLVPSDISVAQFMWIIRKRIQLSPEKAIFLFIGKILPQSSASMGQVYEEHKDSDGFLYIAYSGENTFGCKSKQQRLAIESDTSSLCDSGAEWSDDDLYLL